MLTSALIFSLAFQIALHPCSPLLTVLVITKTLEKHCCPSYRRLCLKTQRRAQHLLSHPVPGISAVLRVLCSLVTGPVPLTHVTQEAEPPPAGNCFWSLSPVIGSWLEPVNQAPDLPALQVPGFCFPFQALEIAKSVLPGRMHLGSAKSELSTVGYQEFLASGLQSRLETFARN